MLFSGEVSNKNFQLISRSTSKNDNLQDVILQPQQTGHDTFHCQKSFQNESDYVVGFKQLNLPLVDTTRSNEKSLRYFFPKSDDNIINVRLKDSMGLSNIVENALNPDSKRTVDMILEQVKKLSTVQKLLLYLKLPSGKGASNPLKQPINPLGSRPEITQTISWIKTHLKPEKETSLPKQDVYNEYQEYCSLNQLKPLSTADFGKVMKQVYPNIRPRRLGTRGNSRYCYAGMANREPQLPVPVLPKINGKEEVSEENLIICKWASSVLGTNIHSISQLEKHILDNHLTSDDNFSNDTSFIQSCKITKQCDTAKSLEGDKRKTENVRSSSTPLITTSERSKGKKTRKGSASSTASSTTTTTTTKKSPLEDSSNSSEAKKPRVQQQSSPSTSSTVTTPTAAVSAAAAATSTVSSKLIIADLPTIMPLKRLKSSTPASHTKSTSTRSGGSRSETEFLENGNSLEQEEELLKYFQRQSDDEPKVSQLRMLLERSKTAEDKTTTKRRVSFEVVPESPNSQKKFSFVPISPISNSPFISPKDISSPQRVLLRSSSVNSPCNKVIMKKEIPPIQNVMHNKYESCPSEIYRSQSVPTTQLPQITPVPSEATDFDINTDTTDSSNILVMDDSSSSLMIDSTLNNENLNQILNIINEIDISKLSKSYPNTPTYVNDPIVNGLVPSDVCKTMSEPVLLDVVQQRDDTNLFDDCPGLNLYCEGDALNTLAREMGRLDADVL